MMHPEAYILPSAEINTGKWDECVARSANGLIYARSDYLDTMADHWHGIVIGDYAAVMPLPWRMKFGWRYAYIPAFTQQMGLVGEYSANDLAAVLRTLPDFVSLADIHFNFENRLPADTNTVYRNNLILPLGAGTAALYKGYRNNLRESLRKAEAAGLRFLPEPDVSVPVTLFQTFYGKRVAQRGSADYNKLNLLTKTLQARGACFAVKVLSPRGSLLATALLLRDEKRIYNLVNVVTEEGRALSANHFLLDSLLRDWSDKDILFDFEGSELPGVRDFFASFGAIAQPYPYYHYNGLPGPIRWFMNRQRARRAPARQPADQQDA